LYQLFVNPRVTWAGPPTIAAVSIERSPVRYGRSGELSIAYQVFGQGPVNVVLVPGFISNLDMMADSYPFGPMIQRLASIGTCVLFDKRGTGLSDRDLGFGSIEERAEDIRAVMDAVGFETASIFGYSEGGALSVFFAASSPERVDALVLYGSFSQLRSFIDRKDFDGLIESVRNSWGTGRALRPFIQGIPEHEAVVEVMARYERGSASPGLAAHILRAAGEIDVDSLLPSVSPRTLVLHSSGDPLIPVEAGRNLAKGIPSARYLEGDADYHWPWDGRTLWCLDDVVTYLTEGRGQPVITDRILATVLFTDIVASTESASRQGDRRWTELLEAHERMAREAVGRFGGQLIKTTGDGLLAIFDSPSRAVGAAHALSQGSASLDLKIRAGVHTGEVERRPADVGGIGVHIGARVMAEARDGEVWVSSTVRDLTTGSGLEFAYEGKRVLKGVPGEWDLYSSSA
jgi:class 3 adenylate cyclase/pimeloyl-ACP methyl ester carboxylesterase